MQPRRMAVAAVGFALCTLGLAALTTDQASLYSSDARQYVRIATNLLRHGEFHTAARLPDLRAAGLLSPYSRRAPGYPWYLAAVFATAPETRRPSAECISDPACEGGAPLRRRVQLTTNVIMAATVAGTFLATFALTANWPVSIAAGLLCLMLLPAGGHELLAALLLLAHAALAALTWRQPRVVTGLASGLALGLLVLTKAIFQYWLVALALLCAIGAWRDRNRRHALLPACAALVIASCAVSLPWMVRNAVQAGHFGVSGRDGEVLAIRAEYGRMTWPEVRGAFAWYLLRDETTGPRSRVMRWMEPERYGYARFDRSNPTGFYSRAKQHTGDVAARADSLEPGWRLLLDQDQALWDAVLKQAAADLMREDWPKHAVLTLAFAARGASGLVSQGCSILPTRHDGFVGTLSRQACLAAKGIGVLTLPVLGVVSVVWWRRRDFPAAFLLLPVVFAFGAHAAATHFITRYSRPLIPLIVVASAVAVHDAWRWRRGVIVRRSGPSR